mgnify:CR=1 FL=1|jgi:hypothetical protein
MIDKFLNKDFADKVVKEATNATNFIKENKVAVLTTIGALAGMWIAKEIFDDKGKEEKNDKSESKETN